MIASAKTVMNVLAIVLGASILAACGAAPISYKVKMTATFDTAAGPRTGTGVFEISAARTVAVLPEERTADVVLRGEAIPVQLSDNQTVYILLRQAEGGLDLETPITSALDPQFTGGGEAFVESVGRLSQPNMVGRSASLPAGSWPAVVTFGNPAQPRSVRYVEASQMAGNPSGARLRQIAVEVTRDDSLPRIEQQLPWLQGLTSQLDGSSSVHRREPANALSRRDFKR